MKHTRSTRIQYTPFQASFKRARRVL